MLDILKETAKTIRKIQSPDVDANEKDWSVYFLTEYFDYGKQVGVTQEDAGKAVLHIVSVFIEEMDAQHVTTVRDPQPNFFHASCFQIQSWLIDHLLLNWRERTTSEAELQERYNILRDEAMQNMRIWFKQHNVAI